MLPGIGQSAEALVRMPDVRAERCVHSLIEQSTCRSCIDACPNGAWVINDEMLGIDQSLCDGCDLCVPACPESAIVQRFRPAVRETPRGNLALACCERARISGDGIPRMPCLHAIGTSDLLEMAGEQVRYLITSTGDCSGCPRGKVQRLQDRLDAVNALLSNRSSPVIAQVAWDAEGWLAIWHQVETQKREKPLSRRGFFRVAVAAPTHHVEALVERAEGRFTPPGRLLPRRSPTDWTPFAPVIDPTKCDGCDACARLCPHAAIRIEIEAGRAEAYAIIADDCTGCRLCRDVCDKEALTLQSWGPVKQERVPLSSYRCRSCGVNYHLPTVDGIGDRVSELCPICTRTGHHGRLFQVLD
jgi:NAD-dependent dihydropyrimidine dehydrogenase PreA subunit